MSQSTRGKKRRAPANRLRELREDAGLTLEKMGEFMGVTHAAVQRWEAGVNAMTSRQIMDLAKILRVHPGEILQPLPNERDLSPTRKRVLKASKTWDEDLLEAWLHMADFLHAQRKRGKPRDGS